MCEDIEAGYLMYAPPDRGYPHLFVCRPVDGLPATWIHVYRATLPLHPVAVGAALGLTGLLPLPVGAGSTRLAAAIYYAASGVCCTWVYDVVRAWAKKRGRTIAVEVIE